MSNLINLENEEKILELEVKRFELEQRRSMALSKSAFFPDSLKGDIASAVIIYDLAQRMNISVLEVSQSIYIIYGRPSFSTNFLVARLNQSGKIKGALKTIISDDKQEAYCEAIDAVTGDVLKGMTYTMKIAKAEGLVDKKGSKWLTMPELMLRKRAQSNFINEYFPEVKFGLPTEDEAYDAEIIPSTQKSQDVDLNKMLMTKTKPTQKPKKEPEPEMVIEPEPDLLEDIEIEPLQEEINYQTGEVTKAYKPNTNILDRFGSNGMSDEEMGE